MESPFGRKLFRLFLLFALTPSLLLALAGYYLASDPGIDDSDDISASSTSVHEYYTSFTYNLIDSALGNPEESVTGDATALGFAILADGDAIRRTPAALPDAIVSQLLEAASVRPHGLVEFEDSLYQYSQRVLSDSTRLIGGLIHGPEYRQLLATYRHDLAAATSRRDLRRRYGIFVGVLFATLALLTLGAAYYFSNRLARNLARPILDLSRAADAIAAGDFRQHVSPAGSGEIRDLIANFNNMAERLDTTTALLAQSERVAAWRHVARRFAHELKNPLQPISISLYRIQKLLADSPDLDRVREPLAAVAGELEHLTDLANRFAALAKLPPPQLALTDLTALLRTVTDLYCDKLAAYDFRLDLPAAPVITQLDETYFREALHNLLQNAMDASADGSVIILRLAATPDHIMIEVIDHGVGMAREVLRDARMPYFTTKTTGSGIGLAIVEKTVSELGGRLELTSTPDRGTSVTIHLPHSSEETS